MNRKGQSAFPILTFVGIVLLLLFLAPFMFKLVNTPLEKFQTAIGNQSIEAGQAVNSVRGSFLNFWDTLIIIAFTISLILLLVSAFLIDVHPIFTLLYVLLCFFIFIFAPMVLDTIDVIYDGISADQALMTSSEISTYLPLTNFIRVNFAAIILGIMVLSGIVMYAKFKFRAGGV